MICAFDRGETCAALTLKECIGCHFRKSQDELDAGRERADDRIASLPDEVQDKIAKKYRSISASIWKETK